MAFPTVTYTFVNATTADATEVNTNFTDLISALSDGTKDLSINALTVAGAATLNGNIALGDATSDVISGSARYSTSRLPSVNNSSDLGSTSLRWKDLWLSGNATISGNVSITGTLASGALTITDLTTTGNNILGNASADTLTVNATITSNLIFTDNTYDIGASLATRPKNLFLSGNATIAGTIASAAHTCTDLTTTGNTILGDASSDTLTINAKVTSNLIATDNTYDIGASGATRFRDFYLARNAFIGGTTTLQNGNITLTIGADNGGTTLTDATTKGGRIAAVHYTNAEEPMGMMFATSTASANSLRIGGGTSTVNAATEILFYAGTANQITTTGTIMGSFLNNVWSFSSTIAAPAGTATCTIQNLNTTSTAHSCLRIATGSSAVTAGDPTIWWNSTGLYSWAMGVDTSDSGNFKLDYNTAELGAGTSCLKFDTTGHPFFPSHTTTASAANAFLDSVTGQLLRSTSSGRYKDNVRALEIDSSKIYDLEEVNFECKKDGSHHFGLVAEEVAKVIPELVEFAPASAVIPGSSDTELIPDGVRYQLLSVLLLKEMKKLKAKLAA